MDKKTEAIIAFLRKMNYQQIVAFPADTHRHLQTAADLLERYAQNEARWRSAQQPPERWHDEAGKTLINFLIYTKEYGVDVGNWLQPANTWVILGCPVTVEYWMPLPEGPQEGDT